VNTRDSIVYPRRLNLLKENNMSEKEIHIVTGAFGYSGKYIAGRLLAEGHQVKTITNSVNQIGRAHV